MAQIYSASIDLTKIDKSKIVEKNGKKYYNISVIVKDEADQYGQILSISEGQTKEENEAKKPKNYIGNGKLVWSSNATTTTQNTANVEAKQEDFDLPF